MPAMNSRLVSGFAAILALLLVSARCGLNHNDVEPSAGLHVLFIGNSLTYANDLPGILQAMAHESGGVEISVTSVTYGGAGLQDHWLGGEAVRVIRRGGWDVVVLQQGPSATEGRPSLLEYSKRFAAEIRKVGARPALYMVWPAESRSFDFDGVSESYRMAAEQVDGLLFPAGEAWRAAWRRDSSIELYAEDRFHPSASGSYLAALVMFQQLTGASPVGLPAHLTLRSGQSLDVPDAWAPLLQDAAVEANRTFARVP